MSIFDDGFRERRLHPLTIFYRAIISFPQMMIIFYLAFMRGDTENWITILLIILFAIFTFPFVFLNYYFFSYQITKSEIIIRSGVLSRRQRNIPIEKVQNIEITQNFLQRILSLAKVSVETAGESGAEASLEYVKLDLAEQIRANIKNYQRSVESTVSNEITKERVSNQLQSQDNDVNDSIFEMSLKENIIHGALRFRPIVFAIFLWFISTAQQFYLLPEIEEWNIGVIETFYSQLDVFEIILFFVALLFISSFVSWIADILLTVNQFYKFKLTKENNKLQTKQGLLSRRRGTIPLKKLQMMVMKSNFLLRKFGYWSFTLETAGFSESARKTKTAAPFAHKTKIISLIESIRDYVFPVAFNFVSRKTIRRAMVRYVIAYSILMLGLYYISPYSLWLLISAPLLYFGAVLMYRNRGYKLDGSHISIKQGYWFQRITIIPIEKIQSVNIIETFFQRKLGLATINIDTAASGLTSDAAIIDIERYEAEEIMEEIIKRFKHRRSSKDVPTYDEPKFE